jgi:putative chitinase
MKLEALSKKLPASVMAEIPVIIEKFGIDGPLRLSHFLSQCAHESGNFKFVKENLNYSADGLRKIFPKYFPTIEAANKYA